MKKTFSLVAGAAILVLLALFTFVIYPKLTTKTVTAHFPAAVGLFPGDAVRILGVDVGKVEKITPEGTTVAVEMRVDKKWDIPEDVQAVILAPTLVTTRFVQLTPAYTGGPTMADGGSIPADRTAMPVEWDVVKEQLYRSLKRLGPQGENRDEKGTLADFVTESANNARGNGETLHETLDKLARTTTALSDGRTDLFAMVRNLSLLVDALSQSHNDIVQFNGHLASVTQLLGDSDVALGQSIADLDAAVVDLAQFVRENKDGVDTAVSDLGSALQVLVDQRRDLEQAGHVVPTTLINLANIYQPAQNSLTAAPVLSNTANPVQFICGAIAGAGEQGAEAATNLCIQYLGPFLKTLAFNYLPLGVVIGNSVGALPGQIEYSEPGLDTGPVNTVQDSQLRIANPTLPGLPGLLFPSLTEIPGAGQR